MKSFITQLNELELISAFLHAHMHAHTMTRSWHAPDATLTMPTCTPQCRDDPKHACIPLTGMVTMACKRSITIACMTHSASCMHDHMHRNHRIWYMHICHMHMPLSPSHHHAWYGSLSHMHGPHDCLISQACQPLAHTLPDDDMPHSNARRACHTVDCTCMRTCVANIAHATCVPGMPHAAWHRTAMDDLKHLARLTWMVSVVHHTCMMHAYNHTMVAS